MTDARVVLWGRDIAAVSWDDTNEVGIFQYEPEFVSSGIQVAPFTMPLKLGTFQFPALSRESFKRLPGLLADSLPDKFGNLVIDTWLARQGRLAESFNPVERLCYVGNRGMGALEFKPSLNDAATSDQQLDLEELVQLANLVLAQRVSLSGHLSGVDDHTPLQSILQVGTSAGGARAKAVLAWNESTGQFRSGQVSCPPGFAHWLIKFDGVSGNRDKELSDPQGFGLIEYAYHLMALDAGIHMHRCRLHREGGRAHFMTLRFDRTADNDKLHMQSLGAMRHYDFNLSGAYSYEQALQTLLELRLPVDDLEQQFRRAVFNVVARNQDDHVKNIAFLMDRSGQWRLSPAFDVSYSYNPNGAWTSRHQMSIQGKRDGFELDDLLELAKSGDIKPRRARSILAEISAAIARWRLHANAAGVSDERIVQIEGVFRKNLVV